MLTVRGAFLAALPALLIGTGNYLNQHTSNEVIAQVGAGVDENVWPQLVEARERIARLEEWRHAMEAEAAETAVAPPPSMLHTKTTTSALPAPPPLPPKTSPVVQDKLKTLF